MMQGLFKARKAGVMIFMAFTSLGIIAIAAFAINLGNAYSTLSRAQRLADVAAYAGAVSYHNAGTTTALNAAVARMATLNGLSSSAIAGSLTASPTGDGNSAVKTLITMANPLYFSSMGTGGRTISIGSTSYAEIATVTTQNSVIGCITALQQTGAGISVTGSGSLTAASCAVASNGTVPNQGTSIYSTCGTTITTLSVAFALPVGPIQNGCVSIYLPIVNQLLNLISSTIVMPLTSMIQAVSVDNLANNPEVTAATSQLTTAASAASPSAPAVSGGTAITLAYSAFPAPAMPSGCSASLLISVWTISCPAAGTYTFGPITLGGGITLNLNTNAAAATRTFQFNGDINGTSGSAINFGAGNYTISGGIRASGSMALTWQGGGTFTVGTTSASPCPAAGYSICTGGSGRVVIPGPSSFTLAGGIYQGASGMSLTPALSLGGGSSANSYSIGKASDGYSLNDTNGAAILGDSTTSAANFTAAGNIASSGGTCIVLPAANLHFINGSLNASGGVVLGAGLYAMSGYAAFGASGGGNVSNCPSFATTTGLNALGVTLVLGGTSTVTCNGISNTAFCLGSGYSSVILTAPTASSALASAYAGLAVVGPVSGGITAGSVFSSGASNTRISGVFYTPLGPITVNGGATVGDTVDAWACLELLGASLNVSAGGALGSTCAGANGTTLIGSIGSYTSGILGGSGNGSSNTKISIVQ